VTQEPTHDLDLDYLRGACERAGLRPPEGPLCVEPLKGGRLQAAVYGLSAGRDRFALKVVPKKSWRGPGMGNEEGGEARLARHPSLQNIRGSITWPILDVADSPDGAFDRLLMRDVSSGFRERGKFTREDTRRLFDGLAAMHASGYGRAELHDLPLPAVNGPITLFTESALTLGRGTAPRAPWVPAFLDDFQVMGAFLPLFLEQLGASLASDYLLLLEDTAWKNRLDELPATLLHGDLRRANIAFEADAVALIDWELASRGPPGCDLQWHCMLHYWGYPPDGAEAPDDCDDLRDGYVQALLQHADTEVDPADIEEGWRLGWIRAMAMLGYVLVDELYPDGGTADQRERVQRLCQRGVRRALEMRASL